MHALLRMSARSIPLHLGDWGLGIVLWLPPFDVHHAADCPCSIPERVRIRALGPIRPDVLSADASSPLLVTLVHSHVLDRRLLLPVPECAVWTADHHLNSRRSGHVAAALVFRFRGGLQRGLQVTPLGCA